MTLLLSYLTKGYRLLQMSVGGGTSRAEALLEERRRVLRTALKGEYIRYLGGNNQSLV